MFTGTHRVRVDEKGRLAIPAVFRRQLPEGSYISMGQDGSLAIYPPDLWEALVSRLQQPLLDREQRAVARALFGRAVPCEFDAQGRVSLSPEQRRLAGIEPRSTAVVIGSGAKVEIWSEGSWDGYSDDLADRFDELADSVIQGHG
jgi:MraZ protein